MISPNLNLDFNSLSSDVYNEPEVSILSDTLTPSGKRITTFFLTFWRPLLPQITRHRVFSFSVQSSRAIPVNKLLEQVKTKPWGPSHFGKNQSGMVALEDFTNPNELAMAKAIWIGASVGAQLSASNLNSMGVHKQVVNRLLEPFIPVNMILTGSDFNNFFKLRMASDSQPEMIELATSMFNHYNDSKPEEKNHLPYLDSSILAKYNTDEVLEALICGARCARVSYAPYGSLTADCHKDMILAKKLITLGHFSPFEHCYISDSNFRIYVETNHEKLIKLLEERMHS